MKGCGNTISGRWIYRLNVKWIWCCIKKINFSIRGLVTVICRCWSSTCVRRRVIRYFDHVCGDVDNLERLMVTSKVERKRTTQRQKDGLIWSEWYALNSWSYQSALYSTRLAIETDNSQHEMESRFVALTKWLRRTNPLFDLSMVSNNTIPVSCDIIIMYFCTEYYNSLSNEEERTLLPIIFLIMNLSSGKRNPLHLLRHLASW